ncbi:MAG: AMP-binding protein [Deltaproteobacteria bacterium]|nr:AMP-binding protein [Deltaproteobacteria bacterium]
MTAATDKLAELGLDTFAPPARLATRSPWKTPADYDAFLERARERPDRFWLDISDRLPWRVRPEGLGGPGAWFPGGRLNLCECCLPAYGAKSETLAATAEIAALGLQPGDRVLLAGCDGPAMATALLACLRLGLVAVPAAFDATLDKLARHCRATRCRAVIAGTGSILEADLGAAAKLALSGSAAPCAQTEPVPVDAMHPCLVLTDSAGQLFTIPSAGFLVQAVSAYRHLLDGRGPGDLHWLALPAHHASFLAALLGALCDNGGVALAASPAWASPGAFLAALKAATPRVVVAGAKALLSMSKTDMVSGEAPRCAGPELLVLEGENAEPGLFHHVRGSLFDGATHVTQVLSRPESGGFLAGPCPGATPVRAASVGPAAPAFDLAIVDGRGGETGLGVGGLVALRVATPGLAVELQGLEPPLTLEVKARADRRGWLWTMGEAKVARPTAVRASIPELEAAMAEVPGVEQAVLVGYEDASGAYRTRAFVQTSGDPSVLDDVRRAIEARFGQDAVPDDFQLARSLPVSRSGKLLRSVLRSISAGDVDGLASLEVVIEPDVVEDLIAGRGSASLRKP